MNDTTPERYTITVDADELPLIAALLGRDLAPKPAVRPRAKAAALDEINTGDPGLDDFMRRSRARGAKALGCPKPSRATSKPPKLTDRQRADLEGAWDSDCAYARDSHGHHLQRRAAEVAALHAALAAR